MKPTHVAKNSLGLRSAQDLHKRLKQKGIITDSTKGGWCFLPDYSSLIMDGYAWYTESEYDGAQTIEWTDNGVEWLKELNLQDVPTEKVKREESLQAYRKRITKAALQRVAEEEN